LTIQRRFQPELDGSHASNQVGWQKVAAVDWLTVDRDEVGLVCSVRRSHVALGAAPGGHQVDLDHGSPFIQRAPFALHPDELAPELEAEVETAVFDNWSQYRDSQPGCRRGDLNLRYGSLAI
jgi:hypothetical protein